MLKGPGISNLDHFMNVPVSPSQFYLRFWTSRTKTSAIPSKVLPSSS